MTTDGAFAHRAHQSLWDLAEPGRSGVRLPESDVPEQPLPDASLLRDGLQFAGDLGAGRGASLHASVAEELRY